MNAYSIITIVLGGGFVSSLIAIFKYKTEKDSVIVSSAAGATEILHTLNQDLYTELARQRDMSTSLIAQNEQLKEELRVCQEAHERETT